MKPETIDKESFATDQLATRQIVNEILNFGVSQHQILQVCYLLSLELEDNVAMKKISTCIDGYLNKLADEEDNEDVNEKDSKKNAIITDF
jgi:hypothetical protein